MKNVKERIRIFETPEEGFSYSEKAFFRYAIGIDHDFFISGIEEIINKNSGNRPRTLHEIAEFFRIHIVESEVTSIDELSKKLNHEPYTEILLQEIYSIDNFKIAEELLRQYEEHAAKKSAA